MVSNLTSRVPYAIVKLLNNSCVLRYLVLVYVRDYVARLWNGTVHVTFWLASMSFISSWRPNFSFNRNVENFIRGVWTEIDDEIEIEFWFYRFVNRFVMSARPSNRHRDGEIMSLDIWTCEVINNRVTWRNTFNFDI